MKKYEVNYTRQFPDHRVGHDFKLYQKIQGSPLQLFRAWKAGYNIALVKYFPMYMSVAALAFYGVYGLYKSYQYSNKEHIPIYRYNVTSSKWGLWSDKKQLGRFDNITNKFENQKGGIRDWAEAV